MLSVLVYRMNFRKVYSTDYESANLFVSIHVILIKERYRGWNFGNVAFVNARLHRIERRVKDDEWTRCILHLHTARVRVLQFESVTHRKREKRVLSNTREDLWYCGSTQKCKKLRNCSTETEPTTFQVQNKQMIKGGYKTSLL